MSSSLRIGRLWERHQKIHALSGRIKSCLIKARQLQSHNFGDIGNPKLVSYCTLWELQDTTPRSFLPALMEHYNLPQRNCPFAHEIPPTWWPKGDKE
ncbi:hypothetical protein CKAN_00157900 [Cinnamomum micranthum f. kanehirae]|uniref:Ethylene insensitive 3-like DNA-binding domain-containing protein n=1 Tax=Cinnamomum micranthum f. kanehirae TaxID=337451 RepID=A0A3S3MBD3_9MAGN|nr:hypothetical protein CKAN_00157900 [Cinnamomum micranthum f. kanehirae]